MLSAYAVDVLPLETLHRAGFQAGPVPPDRPDPQRPSRAPSAPSESVGRRRARVARRRPPGRPRARAVPLDRCRRRPARGRGGAHPSRSTSRSPTPSTRQPTIERVDPVVRADRCDPLGPRVRSPGGRSRRDRAMRAAGGADRASTQSPAEPKRDVHGPATRTRGGPASPCVGWISSSRRTRARASCGFPVCAAGNWRDEATSARVGRGRRGRAPHRVVQHREPSEQARRSRRADHDLGGRRPRRAARSAAIERRASPASSTATPWRSTSGAERSRFA